MAKYRTTSKYWPRGSIQTIYTPYWHCFLHYYLQNAEKLDLMKKAIGAHSNYTKEVRSGRGLLPRDHS